jgi:uncharacterized protein (TIGR02145 family)
MLLFMPVWVAAAFNSYGQNSNSEKEITDSSYQDGGVVINGVKWATRNLAAPGTFAAKPEDAGMFYQWNRKKAWPATGDVTGWDVIIPEGNSWTKANDPSPAGWRVPTLDEIKTLFDRNKVSEEWTTENGVSGGRFTDKATGNSIFLPVVGLRGYKDGTLLSTSVTFGFYWSSTPNEGSGTDAYFLHFYSDFSYWSSDGYRNCGKTVRCVAEK